MTLVYAAKPPQKLTVQPRKKAPKKTLVIGKTKATVMLLLGRYLFLSPDQMCTAAFGTSEPFVQNHLRDMIAADWLLRQAYLRDKNIGKAKYVYSLNTPAWEWIRDHGMPVPERFRPSEEIGKVTRHTMAISEFGVELERFCRHTPSVELAQFWHERVLSYARVTLPDGSSHRLRPDAWVQLAIAKPEGIKQRCLVIEIDRASEYQLAFRKKIRHLLHYRKEAYRQQFDTESIAILFLVPDPQRLKIVLTAIETEIRQHEQQAGKKVRPDLFWVTAAAPKIAKDQLFTGPLWYHPFQPQPVPLLDLTSAGASEHAFNAGYIGEEGMLKFYDSIGERPPLTSLETGIDDFH